MKRPAGVVRALLLGALVAAAGGADAQVDCTQLPADLQPRCMAVNAMNERCAGKSGTARTACERESIDVTPIEDCRKVAPQARDMCEAHNRYTRKMQACNDKRGNAYVACRQASALNAPLNR